MTIEKYILPPNTPIVIPFKEEESDLSLVIGDRQTPFGYEMCRLLPFSRSKWLSISTKICLRTNYFR